MKNYEKYAEKIKTYTNGSSYCEEIIIPNVLKPLGKSCVDTSCDVCNALTILWLLEEYEDPKIDWSKVKVDTPILVRQGKNGKWLERHFAKYEDGIVYVWNLGRTSWSAPNNKSVSAWQYAKLIEDETESGVDWSKVEVDTPILVRDAKYRRWVKRYFAKYNNGTIFAWTIGCTSRDAHNMMTPWKYAKLAESEEE